MIRRRIESIDNIRAISVMTILLVNIGEYYTKTSPGHHPAPETSAVDTWSGRLVDLLVLDKFHLMLAFLFEVSAAIQFGNMSRRGKFWAPYLRRMAILLVFRLANAFLLHAPDVLTSYAINGALLALLFRAPQGSAHHRPGSRVRWRPWHYRGRVDGPLRGGRHWPDVVAGVGGRCPVVRPHGAGLLGPARRPPDRRTTPAVRLSRFTYGPFAPSWGSATRK